MTKPHFRFLYIFIFLLTISSNAQVNLDSLWTVWNDNTQSDTNRIKAMKSIAWDGYLFTDPDSAFYFARLQYNLAKSLNSKRWIGNSLNMQGLTFYIKGNYEKAIEYFNKTLEQGDEDGIAAALNNLGLSYNYQGNYEQAIISFKNSLKIREKTGNKKGVATAFNNIGIIYKNQKNLDDAILCYKSGLKVFEELEDKKGIAAALNNIGIIYAEQGNYIESLLYAEKSLSVFQELEDKKGVASSLNDIGNIFAKQDQYTEALLYFEDALKIFKDLGDQNGVTRSLADIGDAYKYENNFRDAIINFAEALLIAEQIGALDQVSRISKSLYTLYKIENKSTKALQMYELHIRTKDSLSKMDAEEELYKFELDKEYELKKQADSIIHLDEILIQRAENLAKEEQLKSEQQRRTGLLVIVLLILLSLGFVFLQLRKTRTQKDVIEAQHKILNRSHREITDSINYAKRIQDTLMTSDIYIKEILPDSFIFFKPKNVVSGDFYWMYRSPTGQIYFTVVDCTGHGVPGAFMSMIGNSLLNEFIVENNIKDTAEVLTKMREQIIKSLDQKGLQGENKDGMDMALCKYDPKKGTVQYSGAYNPLLHISKNEINQLEGDSQPVGLHTGQKLPFTSKEIQVAKGDMLYIYSDGFPDQFGGEKGKKYLSGKFKKFLLSISDKPIDEQNTLIKEEFTNWIGDHEQIDDVCVMGVRIT